MAIRVLELHDHPSRAVPAAADPQRAFYQRVLGLDAGLYSAAGRGALAVASLDEARAELDRLGVGYRLVKSPDGRGEHLLLQDPAGLPIELHQRGRCGCAVLPLGDGAAYARVSGTILFADMRGFTAVAERLSPEQVVLLLNEFFSMLIAETASQGGTVFHIAGDGLMAGFGITEPQPDACARAVSTARAMIAGFDRLAADWKRQHQLETGLGIGINTGDLIVGNIGAPQRTSYTLIGDAVNVAARLTQRARAGEALFSRAVHQALLAGRYDADIQELPPMILRGRSRPVEIYCIPAPRRLDLRPLEQTLGYRLPPTSSLPR